MRPFVPNICGLSVTSRKRPGSVRTVASIYGYIKKIWKNHSVSSSARRGIPTRSASSRSGSFLVLCLPRRLPRVYSSLLANLLKRHLPLPRENLSACFPDLIFWPRSSSSLKKIRKHYWRWRSKVITRLRPAHSAGSKWFCGKEMVRGRDFGGAVIIPDANQGFFANLLTAQKRLLALA